MNPNQVTPGEKDSTLVVSLYMALELADKDWKLALSDGARQRHKVIVAGDLERLREEIAKAKERFGLREEARVFSCYEAGREGFWLHRYVESCGIVNVVVDPASIEVSRRKRRAKTDRLDAGKLAQLLVRFCRGERKLWSVVRVPTVEEEDARHLHRELEALKKERTMHRCRIRSLLKLHGVAAGNPSRRDFLEHVEGVRLWDGGKVPPELRARVVREYERLKGVEEQIRQVEGQREERIEGGETAGARGARQLMRLCGIGSRSAWEFEHEFFGWRKFGNRRQVAACAGLTPTPYASGETCREQGISKAGSRRTRWLIVEIAWCWLRYQPGSALSQWYEERFAHGGKRLRRIGIVAVARRLLIALWHFREHGVIPEGARLKLAA